MEFQRNYIILLFLYIVAVLFFVTIARSEEQLDHREFWNKLYIERGLSDKSTISPGWDGYSIAWHFNFIERHMVPYLDVGVNLFDGGSGAGHWLKFAKSRGCKVIGNEISTVAADSLEAWGYNIIRGPVQLVDSLPFLCHAITAIGLMCHITDDLECAEQLKRFRDLLEPGGVLFISAHFVRKRESHGSPPYKVTRSIQWWLDSIEESDLLLEAIHFSNEPKGINDHHNLMILRKPR